MEDLTRLAQLIRTGNQVARDIASPIRRPAAIGNVGEYIAARVFRIALEASGTQKGIDGWFIDGPLQGRSVNIKWYGKREGILDITPASLPDDYLVMAGPTRVPRRAVCLQRREIPGRAGLCDARADRPGRL